MSRFAFMSLLVNHSNRFLVAFSRNLMTCRGISLDTKGLYRLHSWEGYYYQSL